MKKINYKQTLKYLKGSVSPVFFGSVQWKQTLGLFDKAIPKKVKRIEEVFNGILCCHQEFCDNCGLELYEYQEHKYCHECGQAINWSEK